MAKTIELPVSEITVDFYVRRSLSDDRVMELGLLLEAGVVLPPITINEQRQVIDGRHRLEAHKLIGTTHITCEMKRDLDRGEQLLEALIANMGGALPPTQSDIRLAIQNMLAAGMKPTTIQKGLPLPPSVARRYISDAQSTANRAKIRSAVEAVTESEMRVQDAADKFGVDVDEVRAEIRGKKKKAKDTTFGLPKIKSELSNRYRSSSQHNAKMFTRLIDGFTDGECSFSMVSEALDLTEKHINVQAQNVASWRQRLAAARRNQEPAR
jgi:ParB-like chromosome segregation protein Spo0J